MGDPTGMVLRETWFTRFLGAVGLITSRALPQEHAAGADFAEGNIADKTLSPIVSMATYGTFPWVVAPTEAKANDLSGLPWILTTGRGEQKRILTDHPFLDLLAMPNSEQPGVLLERQWWTDHYVSGDAYIVGVGSDPNGAPTVLLRLQPQRTKVEAQTTGLPGKYVFEGGSTAERYDTDAVVHIRGASWEDSIAGLYGQGAIKPLLEDLKAEYAVKKSSVSSLESGQPTGILSPADPVKKWNPDIVKKIRASWNKVMKGNGVFINGGATKYEAIGWAPRDMEYGTLLESGRAAQLAVQGVPPTRVGLPGANYATDRQQNKIYWENRIADSELACAIWSMRARQWYRDPTLTLSKDFSGVEALQVSRTERQARVVIWHNLGLSLNDAAKEEGFDRLPDQEFKPPRVKAAPSTATGNADEPDEPTDRSFWMLEAPRAESEELVAEIPATTEEGRAEQWRAFIDSVHAPVERALNILMRRYLIEQSERIAQRMADIDEGRSHEDSDTVQRDITISDIAAIFGAEDEAELLRELLDSPIGNGVRRAFARTARQMGTKLTYEEQASAIRQMVAGVSTQVTGTTGSAITRIITEGIEIGASVGDMQASIQRAAAFSPARAGAIARTEATRAVQAGSQQAYGDAANAGLDIKVQWLTARDSHVRGSHRGIDGQEVEPGAPFTLQDGANIGAQAQAPGGFNIPGEDINCRCTTLPVFPEDT